LRSQSIKVNGGQRNLRSQSIKVNGGKRNLRSQSIKVNGGKRNFRSKSIKVNGGYLEGVKLGLEAVVSWLEVGSLSAGEESGEVTSELEDVLLQAVEEAGLMEVALQPVPHSIPAAHQHCTYNTSLIGLDQQIKISLRILCEFR
jgi:hypothetical protein